MSERPGTSVTDIVISIVVCITAVTLFVLTALMPYGSEAVLITLNAAVLVSGAAVVILRRDKRKLLWRACVIVFVLSAATLALYIPFEKYGWLRHLKNPEYLKEIILSTGNWGVFIYFMITLASVVILPVPASLLIVAGSLVYGPWVTFFVSAAATFAGSMICFIAGRKLGKKLLYWLFEREKVDKYADLLGRKGKVPFVMMMFLPFFPDDLICIAAGLTDMSFRFFAAAVAITRTAYVFVVSFLGSGTIIPFTGWGIAVWAAIFALCVIAAWYINKKLSARESRALPKNGCKNEARCKNSSSLGAEENAEQNGGDEKS